MVQKKKLPKIETTMPSHAMTNMTMSAVKPPPTIAPAFASPAPSSPVRAICR